MAKNVAKADYGLWPCRRCLAICFCRCSTAELTDLYAEYCQADVDDPDYLVNVKSLDEDIDFHHAALTSANAAAAVPANTRAMLGDNTEDFSLADMISVDSMNLRSSLENIVSCSDWSIFETLLSSV